MVEVGEQAPDFALPSTSGPLRLSELWRDRKVVLAFYAEDRTPGCSQELRQLIAEYETIRAAGAEVVAVSADDLESHRAFCQALGGCPFPLVSDPELTAARLYGVVDEDGKRSRRAVFVIDRGGRLLHKIPWYQPESTAQFLEIFKALGVV
ncbi:MAG: peroxiredoxin [Chloroflexota bacterium]